METRRLTLEEKKLLLAIARRTLEERVGGKAPAESGEIPEGPLQEQRGAFVTLTRRGQLRGCIGTFHPTGALHQVVHHMALQAALHDPRFRPLAAKEVREIEIEISALTPLRPVADVNEIKVGIHGLYISKGYHGGVLLPQVAVEHGWDREEFLAHTCMKAGLPPDAWLDGCAIEVFSAEVFNEADPEGSKVSCG
jgi:AmmeMemoRadiSam system protein A